MRRTKQRPTSNVTITTNSSKHIYTFFDRQKVQCSQLSKNSHTSRLLKHESADIECDSNFRESCDTTCDFVSSRFEIGCSLPFISDGTANQKSKCVLGPKPQSVIQQPDFEVDWEPHASPIPNHRPTFKRAKNLVSPMPKMPLDHEATVVVPLEQRLNSSIPPRLHCDPKTATALQEMLTAELTSPVQVYHSSTLRVFAAEGQQCLSSLRNISTDLPAENAGSMPSPGHQTAKKVQFATNSIMYIYRQSSDC